MIEIYCLKDIISEREKKNFEIMEKIMGQKNMIEEKLIYVISWQKS